MTDFEQRRSRKKMIKINILLTLLTFLLIKNEVFANISENLKVQLPDGSEILGRYLTSDSGRGIRAFMGIPYAEPPINELRFN